MNYYNKNWDTLMCLHSKAKNLQSTSINFATQVTLNFSLTSLFSKTKSPLMKFIDWSLILVENHVVIRVISWIKTFLSYPNTWILDSGNDIRNSYLVLIYVY